MPPSFYRRETVGIARRLLGCRLVRRRPGLAPQVVVIVETEAYLGVGDRAAHTWNGRKTKRVLPMWGPGGHAYVYQIYGMHHCLNVVTRDEGVPEAVLLRAAVPLKWWLGESVPREDLLAASGPGRLCRLLGIDRELSGSSLSGPRLWLEPPVPRPFEVAVGPRVGVSYAGEAALWPLRFAVDGCPAVTNRKTLTSSISLGGRSERTPRPRNSSRSAWPDRALGRHAR